MSINPQEMTIFDGGKHSVLSDEDAKQFAQRECAQLHVSRWFCVGGGTSPSAQLDQGESIDLLVWPFTEVTRIEVLEAFLPF